MVARDRFAEGVRLGWTLGNGVLDIHQGQGICLAWGQPAAQTGLMNRTYGKMGGQVGVMGRHWGEHFL